jgi:hypothetical protein
MDLSIPCAKEFLETVHINLEQTRVDRDRNDREHHLSNLINQKNLIHNAFENRHPLSRVVTIEYDLPEMRFLPEIEDYLTGLGYDVTYYSILDRPEKTKITISPSPCQKLN